MMTAMAFIVSINASNTIARAATTPVLYSGAKFADEEKIRSGSAAPLENRPSGGLKVVVGTEIIISGAVSPIARPSARIVPVRIPGTASGRTTERIVCHLLAPMP